MGRRLRNKWNRNVIVVGGLACRQEANLFVQNVTGFAYQENRDRRKIREIYNADYKTK